MNIRNLVAGTGLAGLVLTSVALAHHSAAMFDPARDMTQMGVVKTWQWANPHSWLTVLLDNGAGTPIICPLELGSPNTLFRSGWRDDTFKTGDKVSVTYHPRKDGTPGGALISAVTAEGKLMTWLPTQPHADQ